MACGPTTLPGVRIVRVGTGQTTVVLAAGHLFDHPPTITATDDFLSRDGHHLLLAEHEGRAVGFVSGIEVAHPDKPTEMLLYELGVDEPHRRQGIGRALVTALAELARERGCSGMWVPVEAGDEPAIATYRSAGARAPVAAATLWWDLHQ